MLVEALHPERQPSDPRLQHRHSQARKNMEHAATDQRGDSTHHFKWIGRRMLEEKIVAELEGAASIGRARGATMKTCRQILFLARFPNRVEVRMVKELVL